MKKLSFKIILTATVITLFFFAFEQKSLAATGINRQINFQGKLVNNPLSTNVTDTSYTVVFTFYDNASGGTQLWQETQTVTTSGGIFRVALGSVTPFPANFNFNWDGLYLGIKVNADPEMTPRIQMAAVPFAFNAEKVAGLTVQDSASSTGSTSATLKIGTSATNPITVDLGLNNVTFNTGSYSNGQTLTITSSGATSITLPSSGTLLTNTATANQTVTSTQVSGNVLSIADTSGTGILAGISFNLNGSGTTYDLLGTGSTWSITRAGVLSVVSCSGCGGSSSSGPFAELLGAIVPNNSTEDLLIGGQATASATFHIFGSNALAGTQPVASIAANTTFAAMVVDQSGLGDLFTASAAGKNVFTITRAGNVGINTSNPTSKLNITGAAANTGIAIAGITTGTGIDLSGSSISSGTGISISLNNSSSGKGIYFSAPLMGGGSAINIGNSGSGAISAFTGNYLLINPTRTLGTGGAVSVNDTGNFINVARSNTAQNAGSTFIISGDLVKFSSNCTKTSGECVDTGKILSLTQSYSSASGSVLFISNSGKGLAIEANSTGNTVPVASISGTTSFAAFVVNNNGVGDLFTASASGTNKFTIQNNGLILAPTYNAVGCTLKADTNGLITCGTDNTGSSSGYSPFQELTGAILPNNSTMDFLVGGQSTISAKFAVLGVNTNQPIATVAGQFIVMPQNGWGGQLGIGTTTPGYNLDLSNTFHMFNLASPTLENLTVDLTKEYQTNNTPNITLQTYAPSIYFKDTSPSSVGFTEFVDSDRFMIRKETGTYSNTDAFFSIGSTGAVGIGITSSVAPLQITGGYGSNAAEIINQLNSGDIFAASASGTTKFVITNAGSIGLYGTNPSITNTGSNTLTINSGSTGNLQFFSTSNTLSSAGALTLAGGLTATTINGNTFTTGTGTLTLAAGKTVSFADAFTTSGAFPLTLTSTATTNATIPSGTVTLVDLATSQSLTNKTIGTGGLTFNVASGNPDIITSASNQDFTITPNGTGKVVLGTATNGLTFDPAGATAYTGTGRLTKIITLSPEYAGAVLTASGSGTTTGSMTSDASPSALFRTYYEWSSTQASLQDYTVAVRVTLPQDFSAWDPTSAITIDFDTATTNAPQNKFDFLLFNSNDAKPTTPVVMRTANVSSVAKTWQTLTIPASALTGGTAVWNAAGNTATIYLKMYAGSPAYIQVGDIDFKYLSKF